MVTERLVMGSLELILWLSLSFVPQPPAAHREPMLAVDDR